MNLSCPYCAGPVKRKKIRIRYSFVCTSCRRKTNFPLELGSFTTKCTVYSKDNPYSPVMPPVEKRRIIRSPKLGLVEITFMSNVTGPLGDPPNVPYRKVDPKDVAEGEIEDRGAAL